MAMLTGKGVKPEKAEKALAKSASELAEGEVVWYFTKCNNLKPMTDAVVVTNARVMGLSTGMGFKFKVLHSDIAETSYDPKHGTIEVRAHTGESMTFKAVAPDDVLAVAHYIDYGRNAGVPSEVAAALAAASTSALSSQTQPAAPSVQTLGGAIAGQQDREAVKAQKRERRQQERAARQDERRQRAADELARYGNKIADELFGLRTIRIYDKGFVRVSIPMLGSNAKFERLIDIEASADVSKKTGLGRGAAAVATMGWSLATSNKRGDVYLTITTDVTTHVLHEEPPTSMNLKQVRRLEAAGRAAVRATSSTSHVASDEPKPVDKVTRSGPRPAPSVSDRLRELSALLEEGLVSQEEYDELRTKLLDRI